MGRKNKKSGGAGAKAVSPTASSNKEAEPVPTLSKSAKREVTELVTQLLESMHCYLFTFCVRFLLFVYLCFFLSVFCMYAVLVFHFGFFFWVCKHYPRNIGCHKHYGDSSVVRALDSWSKGRGFESLLERRGKVFLQGQLSVLTLISVSVPPPC